MLHCASFRAAVLLLLLTIAAGGCAQTRRYNVQVMNRTESPITIGLAKEGDPFEPHLASPEEVAVATPSSGENLWPSTVVDPGRIGATRIEGKFAGKADLFVRIYGGRRTLSEVLSISRGSSQRTEAVLEPEPAMNKFIVSRNQDGNLQADPVDTFPATQPASLPAK